MHKREYLDNVYVNHDLIKSFPIDIIQSIYWYNNTTIPYINTVP